MILCKERSKKSLLTIYIGFSPHNGGAALTSMVNTINISVYEVILIFLMFYIKNCGVCTRDEVESNRV